MSGLITWLEGAFRSKTMWTGILVILVALTQNAELIQLPMDPELQKAIIGLLIIVLRMVTRESLQTKGKKAKKD